MKNKDNQRKHNKIIRRNSYILKRVSCQICNNTSIEDIANMMDNKDIFSWTCPSCGRNMGRAVIGQS